MIFEYPMSNAGILKLGDVPLLWRPQRAPLPADASAKEREAHAATLMTLFKSGITGEVNSSEPLLVFIRKREFLCTFFH
ncbi:hypothetical protein [Mesorhizobium huakuii]|uniref:Uncharacterized protein n=1 Tax=Mesorhizobium huakuii TaxID=28104 RepID=A0A7G6T1K6_9HYPH|nr:hypothetical protein [Mesorhizobium huakuii]QND60638.1 hypothetical protein HB778_32145 [Mesorhizobium huakuii]